MMRLARVEFCTTVKMYRSAGEAPSRAPRARQSWLTQQVVSNQ